MNTHAGQVAVLTGAASGFGWECAVLAAEREMKVVMVDVEREALQQAADKVRAMGVEVLAITADVADEASMDNLATQVLEQWGAPHLLFNNAGVGAGGLVWENTSADWKWVLGVNLWGVIHGVRLFVPAMLKAAAADPTYRGHVVNTASMAGLLTPPNMGVYNVSKHAVVALTETLYQDLQLVTQQVTTSVLCPYFVATGIDKSERNRPAHWAAGAATTSQKIGQAMSSKATSSGKVSARQVAEKVMAAMDSGQFYLYSHPQALAPVHQRMCAVIEGTNPPDAFADKPEVAQQLKQALTQGGA